MRSWKAAMDRTETISVELPEDVAELVRAAVESGAYGSASEMVCDALRDMAEREAEHEKRLNDIIASIEKAEANPVRYTDSEIREHFRRRYEQKLAEFDRTT